MGNLKAAVASTIVIGAILTGVLITCASLPAKEHEPKPADAKNASSNTTPIAVVVPHQPNPALQTPAPECKSCQLCQWMWTNGPADYVLILIGWLGIVAALVSLKEIQAQSIAAKRSADLAEQALIISERAYIDIGDWHFGGWGEDSVVIFCTLKTTGRTPATVLDGEVRLSMDSPIEMKPHLDPRLVQPIVGQVVTHLMEPSQLISFSGCIPKEVATAWAKEPENCAVFVGGKIRYRDAFKDTPVHVRHFSYRVLPPDGRFVVNTPFGWFKMNYEEDEKEADPKQGQLANQ